ncbi:MAG: CorA family divalent cation transporter [Akkermansiaceae bacterium]|jgi:hypothetical protein|nr:CorA family divalent cation transporter [Akkermansiaceae bacterium]
MERKAPTSFLPKSWDLPKSIRRRLGDGAGRQRLMDEEGHLLLILHEAPRPEDEEVRRPVLIWVQPDGTSKSNLPSGGWMALEEHLGSYRKAIHELDDAVDVAATPRDAFEVVKRCQPLLRSTRNLLAVLEDARKARPDERRFLLARDQAIDLERAMDLASGDAKASMDFTMAVNAEAQARASYEAGMEARRLNRLVAFFFPLATLVAVFGMNPPAEIFHMHGVGTVIAVGIGIGFLVWLSVLRRK